MDHNTKLSEGKAIGAFYGFVDTFNHLVDFCNNLKGEGEESEDSEDDGLRVDRSVEDHPVIRGGGSGVKTDAESTFPIVSNIRYDQTLHQLQKKTVSVSVSNGKITKISSPSDWTMIDGGQAAPLYVGS